MLKLLYNKVEIDFFNKEALFSLKLLLIEREEKLPTILKTEYFF